MTNISNPAPHISVIIPTYNRARMLKEAIDSVLAQEYSNFELIVVDDGSTDDTPDILSAYEPAISVIRQPNQGVSAARNTGISKASGCLIAFLDSDDLWLPKKLATQAAFFDAYPEALICQTEEIWIRNGFRVNPRKHHKKESGMIFERSLHLCLVSPSAVMVRKDLFDIVGRFDETLPACEDYDLWLRVSRTYPVYLIDTPLIVKRGGHEDQLSRAPALDEYRIRSITKLLDKGGLTKTQRGEAVAVLEKKCRIFAGGCRKRGKHGKAARILALAERYKKK